MPLGLGRFCFYRVAQHAQRIHLHFHHVAGPHVERWLALEAHAAGRAGDDDVARLEFGEAADVAR